MEKSVDEEDDLGSGWLQVKKKHRSSSRFSLQGWVGALSGKQNTNPPHSQGASFGKNRNSQGKFGSSSRVRGDLPVQRQGITFAVSSVPDKVKEVHILDKNVVCQDAQPTDSHSTKCVDESVVKENSEKDNHPNSCPKIKWGDLDDEDLTQHIKNTVGAEFRFGDFQNGGIITGKAEDSNSVLSCTSPNVAFIGNKEAVTSVDDEHALCRSSSFAFGEEDNCKDVNEVLLEDVKVENTSEEVSNYDGKVCNGGEACNEQMEEVDKPMATVSLSFLANTEKVSNCDGNVSNGGESCNEKMESVNNDPTAAVCLSVPSEIEKNELEREVSKPTIIHEVSISEKPDAPMTVSGPDKTGDSIDAASSFEGSHNQQADESVADLSYMEVRSGNDGDESVESKERFRQRLWCFLFENLNRAVDELYLLCELECDMEQMNEALLVLDEAAFDFNELKSRVEKFENVKGSTAQIVEVPPSTMKSDLRRPHAVSWEVRRMSTSPHKADILSSSLEAFRKIQQERAKMHAGGVAQKMEIVFPSRDQMIINDPEKYSGRSSAKLDSKEAIMKIRDQSEASDIPRDKSNRERRNSDSGRACKINLAQKGHLQSQNPSVSGVNSSKVPLRERSVATSITHKIKKEQMGSFSETERQLPKKEKVLTESNNEKLSKSIEHLKKQNATSETDKDKKLGPSWKTMDAWKEKRNWEDILASPCRGSSRYSHSPGINRKSAERTRNLHVKLMSPEMKKKTASDWKKEADQKHARATRIRNELENEKIQKLQRSSEKLTRVNEWQAVRSTKLKEEIVERHQRIESRHEAFLAQVAKRAGDETIKVNEVRFITSLNDENKKLILRQKHQDSELRRAEKLQVIKSKQKEDIAREEAVLERKKILAAEKLQRLAEIQRRKEEAQVKREEERKALSAVREAKAMENIRRKVIRAKAQQEEAELLAQKLAERLRESEQRRKFYLEQIRERASMDFRDQSSPFLRRSVNKDAQGRSSTPTGIGEEYEGNSTEVGGSNLQTGNVALQQSLKRRIKKLRQKLMALKYEFSENPVVLENGGIGYKTAVGTARSKVGRWLQELQKFRQARKEGAAGIGLITAEMTKFLEGKEPELQAARQAGLIDFIASALPASHTSKPEAYQVTIYLLRLLKVVLSLPANRSYFIAQNLLPPIIPLLAATLENYIKIAASSNGSGSSNLLESKTSVGNLESISEALDGFVWTVTTIIGHGSSDERQLQMQDGLLELVLAYQVIHRLRDLFALYDRPQVEGSPFHSSIHLSINLLAVLTSRSRDISSIAWESSVMENRSELDVPNNISASLPEVPTGTQGVALFTGERNKESVFHEENSNRVKIESSGTTNSNIADNSQNILVDDSVKPFVPQKDEKSSVDDSADQKTDNRSGLKPSVKFLLSAISETGLVCLPSLLTAVLLQANNRLSSDLAPHVLPSNFEEVATGVLKVLNNLALIDISFIQKMLARPDLKMEFFHLMGFLLTYCTSKWRAATDQVGLLLLESLLLLGYFSLFHPSNQAVLRWGKSPTILHKVCDLPFVFFSDPELMPVLASTLVAACYGCEQNKGVVQQELSTDMLLSLLKSCRNSLPAVRSSSSPPDNYSTAFPNESNQAGADSRKIQPDATPKSSRQNGRNSRIACTKSGSLGNWNTSRSGKIRNQKDNKTLKLNEEISPKQYTSAPEASSTLMLHSRFSDGFIDRAELFFTAETTILCDEV